MDLKILKECQERKNRRKSEMKKSSMQQYNSKDSGMAMRRKIKEK